MSVPDAALLRLSATLVAQHFRFRCGRRLRYEMCPPEGRAGVVPPPGPDPTGGSAPLLRMGRRWERHATRRALQRFGPERVAFSGWSAEGAPLPLPWERTLATLREPGGVELLVQPELRLPDPAAFAKRFGVPAGVRIAAAQPDLLRLRRGAGGGVLLEVIDIKGSRSASVAHFAQVAFYSLLLEEICRSERLAAGAEGRSGWV
ncbi:MAG: hypothetical protein M3409_11180, partial [Gemmatimonadota bacterium]|nr:hypothetical protein [Gemmatimonadota bacterium]